MKNSSGQSNGTLIPTTKAAQALTRRYADCVHFLECFRPDRQIQIAPSFDAALDADTPTMLLASQAYGRGKIRGWLLGQLKDLSEFAGVRDKMSTEQMSYTARVMLQEAAQLTMAQVMHFFLKMKKCDYGKFYGVVDPMTVLGAFKIFRAELWDEQQRRHQERMRQLARKQSEELKLEKENYFRRIPGADTDDPLISYPAYCALHLEDYGDGVVTQFVCDLQSERKRLPPVFEIWNMNQHDRTELVLGDPEN